MAKNPDDLYGSGGAADYTLPQGGFTPEQHINASPDAFGASVGQATQQLGATEEKVGAQTVDLATKYQGLINETMATNAESALIEKNSKLKGEFLSTEGLESSVALPGYINAIQNNDAEIRKNLPAGALRMYDTLATRQKANYMSDAQSYAASQIRKANMDSHAMLINAAESAPLDPDVANNPTRVGDALGTVSYAHGAMLDEMAPGMKTDDAGQVTFDESSAEGQYQKKLLQSKIENSQSVVWQNTFNTLAAQDPVKAADIFEAQKDKIPSNAQVAIEASLTPKVVNYKAQGATGYVMLQADQAHQEFLTNPQKSSSSGSNPYNLGNVKTAAGAANNTNEFEHPATPMDGIVLTANNLRKNYQGLTLAQIGDKWAPSSENNTSDWVKNVSAESGISPDATPDLNDPQQLSAVLKGIATAEKSPVDRANFTDDVITQGAQASINGGQAKTLPAALGPKNYATNPDGSPVSQADYYAANRDKILSWGEQRAEQDYPGNPTYRNMVRERLNNQMNAAIQAQSANFRQDNMVVQRAITGGMTNGKPPSTYAELQAIPGVNEVLNRVWVQDPKYAEGIDTQLQKMANKGSDTNSINAYETLQRALEVPTDDDKKPNRIANQEHLATLMGKSDGTGINAKDYDDIKPVVEAGSTFKTYLATNMNQIKNLNGNVDGQGESRALQWYNHIMDMKKENDAKGDKALSAKQFTDQLSEKAGPAEQAWWNKSWFPSRAQQIANTAKNISGQPVTDKVRVMSPDGRTGMIPSSQLDEAIKSGYKEVK